MKEAKGVPRCACGGIVKPDVVLYGESLDRRTLADSVSAIGQADLMIVGGTSLTVSPAAGLIQAYRGRRLVLINRDRTPYDCYANLVFHQSLGEVFFSAINDKPAVCADDVLIICADRRHFYGDSAFCSVWANRRAIAGVMNSKRSSCTHTIIVTDTSLPEIG